MQNPLAIKRIAKDIDILCKNKADLVSRGMHVHINEQDMSELTVLIIPRPKSSDGVESPYTYGHFVFVIKFQPDHPMSPPTITFHPKQNLCRLHPNYYCNGKVCLSVINTWGADWTPATSILAILNILEERLNEKAVCFEPSREAYGPEKWRSYNTTVEYCKYVITIMNYKQYNVYAPFVDIIEQSIRDNKDYLMARLKLLRGTHNNKILSDTYSNSHILCDCDKIIQYLEKY